MGSGRHLCAASLLGIGAVVAWFYIVFVILVALGVWFNPRRTDCRPGSRRSPNNRGRGPNGAWPHGVHPVGGGLPRKPATIARMFQRSIPMYVAPGEPAGPSVSP